MDYLRGFFTAADPVEAAQKKVDAANVELAEAQAKAQPPAGTIGSDGVQGGRKRKTRRSGGSKSRKPRKPRKNRKMRKATRSQI